MVLPEEYTGAAVYYRDTDITYDSQLFFLFVELQEKNASPETWAAHIAQFLHDQALVLPPGAVKMRFTANHDTVSWTCQKKRPRDAYGFERARALASLCALIEGTPMIYQGEENPAVYGGEGISSADHIAAIMAIRRRLPGLTSCRSDYLGVESSGGVFSCVRGEGKESVLVLISFNPEAVITEVKLPAYLREVVTWQDALGLQRFHGGCAIPIEMAPHAVRVLTEIEQKGQI
jgi:hypothetical protein